MLTGPSGGGKTTLLAVLLGSPTSTRAGSRWTAWTSRPARRRVAAADRVAAAAPVPVRATVADNIPLGTPGAATKPWRRPSRRGGRGRRRRAARRLGHPARRARHPPVRGPAPADRAGPRLPARTPSLVLLDEPTARLDPDNAAAVRAASPLLDGATGIVAHTMRAGRTWRTRPCASAGTGAARRRAISGAAGSAPAAASEPSGAGGGEWLPERRSSSRGRSALRMLALGRPRAGRFKLGVLAGATATVSGVGRSGVGVAHRDRRDAAAADLSVAIVATRALGVLRGVTRYLERLVTHDAALRTLADARARVFARLAHTEPVRRFRSGDLVTRSSATPTPPRTSWCAASRRPRRR